MIFSCNSGQIAGHHVSATTKLVPGDEMLLYTLSINWVWVHGMSPSGTLGGQVLGKAPWGSIG